MHKIKAYKREGYANLSPLAVKRDWMDNTWEAHAYHCFPVSLANQMGWSISFPEDITFIWDGINDSSPDHVKILAGDKYVSNGRANATISFNTGISFETDNNISLFSMPVPNYPRDGVSPFSTIMSTSFYNEDLPCAWIITKPNVEITIKANTPVIAILPINLSDLQNSEVNFHPISEKKQNPVNMDEYSDTIYQINRTGKWTDFYRNAVDHKGNKLGEHQVKAIRLSVNN
jgi:Family of unknown function (DUF6065)